MIEQHIARLGGIQVSDQAERAVTEADVAGVEAHINASLPDDYRAFLLKYGSGRPHFGKEVDFPLATYASGSFGIDSFIGAVPMKNAYCYGLVDHYDQSREDLPDEILPIAEDGAGNYVCLAVKGDDKGRIYFWNHEEFETEDVPTYRWLELIASSFDDFLSQFQVDDFDSDVTVCHKALIYEMRIHDAVKTLLEAHDNSEDPWLREIPEADALFDFWSEFEIKIPQGEARRHWNANELAKRDALLPEIEANYQEPAMRAFEAIIDHWQPSAIRLQLEAWKRDSPDQREKIVETSRDFWEAESDEYKLDRAKFERRYRDAVEHITRMWGEGAPFAGHCEKASFPSWARPEDAPLAVWKYTRLAVYVAIRQRDNEWPLQLVIGVRRGSIH